jgi:hypothetical protein
MVRLKNPMGSMTELGEPPPGPAVDEDVYLLAQLDAALREAIRRALVDVRGRILVVGALWPELALDLAAEGRFVTLLDPRSERLAPIRSLVFERGLAERLTLDIRSYAEVSFEAAAFEAIVLYEPFPYLASPGALHAKCRRELRAGGQLLMRAVLTEGAPFPDAGRAQGLMAEALEVPPLPPQGVRARQVRDRALRALWSALRALRLIVAPARERVASGALGDPGRRGLTWATLSQALDQNFVVTDVRAFQLASFEMAELACALRPPLARLVSNLVPIAQRLDERLLSEPGLLRALAPAVLVHATKQRELGRVFVLPRR